MKYRTLSFLLSFIALCLIYWYNIEVLRAHDAIEPIAEEGVPVVISGNPTIKLLSLASSVAGLLLGVFSLLKSEQKAKYAILVSFIVIIGVFLSFWQIFI